MNATRWMWHAMAFLVLTAAACWGQIVPGQELPSEPVQPGQLGPAPSKPQPSAPNTSNKPLPKIEADSPTLRVTRKIVFAPTTVTDRGGNYINGLNTSDFVLYDNGKPQKIESDLVDQPVSVVLVIQANADVEPVLPKIKQAGILVHGLVTGHDGDLAILAFDHRMQVLQGFTNEPSKIDDAMQKLTAGSSTAALIDAVLYADRMLKRHDPSNTRRRVILLMSRDIDHGSESKLEEAIHSMQFDNVAVYCVNISKFMTALLKKPGYPRPQNGGQPPAALPNVRGNGALSETNVIQQENGNVLDAALPTWRAVRDLFKKTPAEAFTVFTRGRNAKIYDFATQSGLETAITDIGKDINSQYLLTYSPNDQNEPGFHTIKVEVDRPDLQITTRPGYWWGGGKEE